MHGSHQITQLALTKLDTVVISGKYITLNVAYY